MKVEFKGFKVAHVYPESLANVPSGSQQILLGRYLPEGQDQSGEVIVTGMLGGKPVRFSTHALLKNAEQGNSFIPRLWARMHLDSLLDQGSSDAIKDEIIALSEDFQIITPYTSLLVLETDADRERFKVKRRFQMRDGERFFADGRDNAVFDLTRKQMKAAGNWRTALRRAVLSELASLGRQPRLFQPQRGRRGLEFPSSRSETSGFLTDLSSTAGVDLASVAGDGGDLFNGEGRLGAVDEYDLLDRDNDRRDGLSSVRVLADEARPEEAKASEDLLGEGLSLDASSEFARRGTDQQEWFGQRGGREAELVELDMDWERFAPLGTAAPLPLSDGFAIGGRLTPMFGLLAPGRFASAGRNYGQWLNTLYPPLAAAPGEATEPKSTWPAEARELARSLLRTGSLAKLTGALAIKRVTETFEPRWNEISARSSRLELIAAKSWLTRAASDGGQTLISWSDSKEIATFSQAFQLGRRRVATPGDVQPPPLELADYSMASVERSFSGYTPSLEPQSKGRVWLVLKYLGGPYYETRMLIDTTRHVVLAIENRDKARVTGATRFDDFVEAGGSWWARRIETTDAESKRVSLTTQTIDNISPQVFDQRVQTELAGRDQVQFLHLPLPSVAEAKKASAAGKATFEDQFVMVLYFELSQQWTRVFNHLEKAEALAAGKPGMRWLRSALLHDGRRHEELRKRYQEDAARLTKVPPPANAYFLAEYIVGQSSGILQANEMLGLLEVLGPLYDAQPAHVHARRHWQRLRVNNLNQTGRSDEGLRLLQQLATDYPRNLSLQHEYARASRIRAIIQPPMPGSPGPWPWKRHGRITKKSPCAARTPSCCSNRAATPSWPSI